MTLRVARNGALKLARHVHLLGATGQIRTAEYKGQAHVVVPVVAMVEGVIHPVNAPAPEFVSAAALAVAPQGWNGRPVLPDHPSSGGQLGSANDPVTLERESFGTIFNAAMDGKKLTMEAWLDPARAEAIGGEALRTLERVQAGELVEVSVGAFVTLDDRSGTFHGARFAGSWRDITPDHLAMLPAGAVGACSTSMGCGAPRAATVHMLSAEGLVAIEPQAAASDQEPTMDPTDRPVVPGSQPDIPSGQAPDASAPRSLWGRFKSLLSFRGGQGDADVSDMDLRRSLDAALRSLEPGYLDIEAVFPAESSVVYAVAPEDSVLWYRRDFTLAAGGTIEFPGEREEVQPVTRFEAVGRGASQSDCGCGKAPVAASSSTLPESKGDDVMTNKSERLKALIANQSTPFAEADLTVLEQLPDERVDALEQHYGEGTSTPAAPGPTAPVAAQPADSGGTASPPAAAPTPATPASAPAQPVATPSADATPAPTAGMPPAPAPATPNDADAYIESAPEEIRDVLADGLRASRERKASLIGAIKASGRSEFADAELEAMSADALARLAKLAAVQTAPTPAPDYSGRGVPRIQSAGGDAPPEPPDLYGRMRAAATAQPANK